MTVVAIVWDEDVSVEEAENWVEAMIEQRHIVGAHVDRVLINNKLFKDCEGIIAFSKLVRLADE